MVWRVDWRVEIDGEDRTASWREYLISISVTDQAGSASDSCSLTIDDTGGQLRLPRGGEAITVYLEGVLVFEGVLNAPTSSGGRNEGRRLSISAKGFDTAGKAKEVQAFHKDDSTLEAFLGQAAENAGFELAADPALGGITREYWSAEYESFLALGQRLAREFGGTFKLRGNKAVLAKRGEGKTPSGGDLPVIEAAFGKNLISWSITPKDPRRVFGSGSGRWFDRDKADVVSETVEFGGTEGVGQNVLRLAVAGEADARDNVEARSRESERESGGGTINLDLAPEARAECTVVLTGARPGIDGSYRVESVTHSADRTGGATTSLTLKQPKDGAGRDNRKSGAASSQTQSFAPTEGVGQNVLDLAER